MNADKTKSGKMKRVFFPVIFFVLVVSCSPTTLPTPITRNSTLTALPPTITATPLPPTATLIPTATPTSTPELIVKTCPEIKRELPTKDIDGTLILNGAYLVYDDSVKHYVLNPGSAYLWDIKDNKKVDVFHEKDEELSSFFVSPNHKLFVYAAEKYDGSKSRITVVAADGKLVRNIVRYDWLAPLGWLDDHNLAIWVLSNATDGPPFPTLIYNPFTRATKLITPDYPKISVWPSYGWSPTQTVYDPSLKFVAYITLPDGTGSGDVVLWDISLKKELIRLRHLEVARNQNAPLWSPDGQKFLIDAKLEDHASFELYSVNLHGEIQQLTHFEKLLGQETVKNIELWNYSWSGDGRYIAFWYRIDEQKISQLALLDTSSDKINNLCLTSYSHLTPIWSPDNQQLLIDGFLNADKVDNGYQVMMVDIKDNYAVEITKDVLPEGWLTNSP